MISSRHVTILLYMVKFGPITYVIHFFFSLSSFRETLDPQSRIVDKAVASSRIPTGPHCSSGTGLEIVRWCSNEKLSALTPENRVEQVHWRHFQRLIY
jgi:hypothetical protein